MVLGRTRRWAEAVPHFQFVVDACPGREQALYWLALAKKNTGDPGAAAELCEKSLAIAARNPILLNELGLCRMTLNQPELAVLAFDQAIRIDPTKGVYHFNHGLALVRLDRIYKARDAFREAIRLDPDRVEATLELVRILEILNARQEVVTLLKQALERSPADFQLLTALASATSYAGNRTEAEDLFRRAVVANPVSANSYGLWLQQEGRFEESVNCFLTSIRAMPGQGVAYYGLAEAKVFEVDGVSLIDLAGRWVDSPELDLKGKTYLCYALAKAYERKKDSANTIRCFDLANASAFLLYNEGRPFDRTELAALTERTIKRYSATAIRAKVDGASESMCPIFIVGMIRSGTTLLDQVISSHPQVASAGEPVFWMREADRVRRLGDVRLTSNQVRELAANYLAALEAVAGRSPRITDKMPLNYAHLGLIHQVFPNAKIIHLRRDPLDTCFSIYTTYLGQGPTFAYNRSNIVFNYRQYLRIMAHWRQALPASTFLEVEYETLIHDRERITRELIQFCGLDWDDACLFHERNESSIRTPSKWQARQPIYSSSIHRWRPYEPWLGELLELKNLA
jgi:tetratricopeptide (TPR) repeat protein